MSPRTRAVPTSVELPGGELVRCRSGFEAEVLAALVDDGLDPKYEDDRIFYTTAHIYTPDVTLYRPNGSKLFIEAKGWFKQSDRSKMLAVKEENPSLDIRLVFQRASTKLNRRSSTTYAQWAERHGFLWAEGRVPAAWITEEED